MCKALSDFEARTIKHTRAKRLYIARRNWLVEQSLLQEFISDFPFFQPGRIPGLTRRRLWRLILANFTSKGKKKLHLTADAIELKPYGGHLRAFYLPGDIFEIGASIKIVPIKASAATRREIEFRQKLEALGTITIPAVYKIEEDDDFFYLVEEMIAGQNFTETDHLPLFIQQGLPELMNSYKALGITYRPLAKFFPQSLASDVTRILSGHQGAGEFLKTLKTALLVNPSIPASYGHKDIQPANLGVSQNKLYFFDWEACGECPILWDLLQLAFRLKNNELLLAEIKKIIFYETENPEQHAGAVFTAYTAKHIKGDPAKADKYLNIWLRHHELFNCGTKL